jgi:hypothetical protein
MATGLSKVGRVAFRSVPARRRSNVLQICSPVFEQLPTFSMCSVVMRVATAPGSDLSHRNPQTLRRGRPCEPHPTQACDVDVPYPNASPNAGARACLSVPRPEEFRIRDAFPCLPLPLAPEVWKCGIRGNSDRGFESLSLRQKPLYNKGFATLGIPNIEAIDEIHGQIFDPRGDPIWVPGKPAWTPLDGT